jgi:hypothetical protein
VPLSIVAYRRATGELGQEFRGQRRVVGDPGQEGAAQEADQQRAGDGGADARGEVVGAAAE